MPKFVTLSPCRLVTLSFVNVVVLALAAVTFAQSPTDAEIAEGSLQTCLRVAADLSPIYPTDTFPADMTAIHAPFQLGENERYNTLGSSWIAVDVGEVAPPNTEIARFDFHLEGLRRSQFVYTQKGPMPPGKYRLDVTADGKPWKSVEFTVLTREQTPKLDLAKVRDLLPVIEGKVWEYDFVQEGINISIPGLEPDAEGKLHATVKMTVGAVEPIGIRIRTSRNDQPVLDEWWRVTEGGVYTVRSAQPDGQTAIFQPPVMWLPFPPESSKLWTYEPRDKGLKQTFRMWGPVPLPSPAGEALGYVVVSEQDIDTLTRVSTLRYYVPGVGMTRETIITAFNDEMLRKQEMILKTGGASATSPAP